MKPTQFTTRIATTSEDLLAVQRLRYDVFVTELGATGVGIDHNACIETDCFDAVATHLMLIDATAGQENSVIGAYRLMDQAQACRAGRFYSAAEFDIHPILASGRKVLELGRSCLRREYRGGSAMGHLWGRLSRYILEHDIEVLFGTASFSGAELAPYDHALSRLRHDFLAHQDLRPSAIGPTSAPMGTLAQDQIDRRQSMIDMPPLIKAYLRLGGRVGTDVFIDHDFGTIDVCLVLDTANQNTKAGAIYREGRFS